NRHRTEDQEIQIRYVENAGYHIFYAPFILYSTIYTSGTNQCNVVELIYLILCKSAITEEVSISNVDKRGCLHTVSTPMSIEGSFTKSAKSPLITASPEETLHPNAICTQGKTSLFAHEFNGGSIQEYTPTSEESIERREAPSAYVQTLEIGGNVRTRLSTGSQDMYALDMIYSTAVKVIYLMSSTVSAMNECSNLGIQKRSQSRPLQTAMSKEPSSSKNVPRRPRNQGDGPSYIDLGDCDHQCRHCGCLFWYNERLKGNDYGRAYGEKIDDSVNRRRGPYVFKVYGQTYHWIRSLCPEEGRNEDTLNPEIVEGIIHILDEHNGLVRLFRTTQDRCGAGEIP
nr:hypothetical protein [Tanacetum cinerariifolium]